MRFKVEIWVSYKEIGVVYGFLIINIISLKSVNEGVGDMDIWIVVPWVGLIN